MWWRIQVGLHQNIQQQPTMGFQRSHAVVSRSTIGSVWFIEEYSNTYGLRPPSTTAAVLVLNYMYNIEPTCLKGPVTM